jgi:prevent-host-death family protein
MKPNEWFGSSRWGSRRESGQDRFGADRPMKIIELKDATDPLADYVARVAEEPVVITAGGKPLAALVFVEDLDLETARLAKDPKFLAIIERSRRRLKTEGGIAEEARRLSLSGED